MGLHWISPPHSRDKTHIVGFWKLPLTLDTCGERQADRNSFPASSFVGSNITKMRSECSTNHFITCEPAGSLQQCAW